MDERVLQDQKLTDVLKGLDRVFVREVEDPVEIARKFIDFLLEALAAEASHRGGQDALKTEYPRIFFGFSFEEDRCGIKHVWVFNFDRLGLIGTFNGNCKALFEI